MEQNIYRPWLMTIREIKQETPDIKTFRLAFQDGAAGQQFTFDPGQFGIFSVFQPGEAPAPAPTRPRARSTSSAA